MRRKKLGFIVNPIAGIGGTVGLKGSDGVEALARKLGAEENSAARATRALEALKADASRIQLMSAGGRMGEEIARLLGFEPTVVSRTNLVTTAADTHEAASTLVEQRIDLLLFAGGDGTARDLFEVIGDRVPLLGIPAGVKMHSAVFATTPRHAGEVAQRFLFDDRSVPVEDVEIMDRDSHQSAHASPRLFGFARTPRAPELVQRAKTIHSNDEADLSAACAQVAQMACDGALTIIGPGTTTRMVKRALGVEGTLDGVDLVHQGRVVAFDQNEAQILAALAGSSARIVVSAIGGQGSLFGRGNQQISARVIARVGRENITILASRQKLLGLPDGCLFVDTGDPAVDRMLCGYIPVLTGPRERMMFRVVA